MKDKKNSPNFPTLRFPEFQGEWEEKLLGEVCEINPSTPPLASVFFYIDLESVDKGTLKCPKLIAKTDAPSRAQRVLQNNDILYQCVRPYQLNNLIFTTNDKEQWVASTGYAQLRTVENNLFVYYTLNTPKFNHLVMNRCTGTSYPAITFSDLGSIPISICTPFEQKKIGTILSLIDKRIDTQIKIIEELERLKKGALNQLISRQDATMTVSLSDLGEHYTGLTGKTSDDFGSGKPYITYLNVNKNTKVNLQEFGLVSISEEENQNQVQYGDILFTTSSETPDEVGISSVYLSEQKNMYLNSFCFGVRNEHPDLLNPEYSAYFFSSQYFRKLVVPLAQGSTRFNVNKTSFLKKKVTLPNIEKQILVANLLNKIDKKFCAERALLNSLESQKKYLLQNLFI